MKSNRPKSILRAMFLLLATFVSAQGTASAQDVNLSGKVTDETGQPVIGATVTVQGSTQGTSTGTDGSYTLRGIPAEAVVIVSHIGYVTQEIPLGGRTRLDVVIRETSESIDDVIVVAYGTQKKINVTGAVAQVSSKELLTAPSGNLSSTLQGRLPGLVTKQTSGKPGEDGSSLYVRGVGAGDGSLLVVVDGVIRSFPNLPPEEIESITILKDATAAAAYGVRASAGVMLITTKRGTAQKPTVTLSSSYAVSTNTNFPKFLNGPDYAYWYDKAQELDGIDASARRFSPEQIDRITNGDPQGTYGNTDWFGLLFKNTAPTYSNNVSLSGGSDKFKYFVSLGAFNQEGVIDKTSYDRYSARINLDAQVSRDFSISFGMAGREEITKEPGLSAGIGNDYASIISQAMMAYPYLPAYTESGMYVGSMNGAGNGNQNPLAARDLSGRSRNQGTKIETNLSVKYDLPYLPGLSFKVNGAYDKTHSMKKVAQLPYELSVYNQSTGEWSTQWARHLSTGEAQVNQWYVEKAEYTIQSSINYANTFGKHSVAALFLYEYNKMNNASLSAGMRGYPITDIMDISFGEEIIAAMIKGAHGMDRRAGYVGRLNYSYDEKYLFEFTARYDGTPYLPSDNRWGFFPGVSAGWRISQEPFFRDNVDFVNNLKLRASAGRLGSDRSLDYSYSYLSTMALGTDPVVLIGNKPYSYLNPSYPPNTNLKWQTTDTYNIGVEADMWNGMLGVELDAFYMKTTNKLEAQSSTFPPSVGTYYPRYVNYGSHENKGLELVLTHRNTVRDFRYNVRGNVSWARNRILQITEDVNAPEYLRSTGARMGQLYGFKAIGLFQSDEEIARSAVYGPTLPGDIKLLDVNGDGRITWDQDRVPIGRSSIPEMIFGLNLGAEYKNFDFNMFFQGAALVDVAMCGTYTDKGGISDNTFYTKPFYVDGNAPYYLVEGSWTPDNTNAKYPRLGVESRDNGGKFSSWWIVNGAYLRLKSAQIGYTIPSHITGKIGIERLRAYVSGSNLFTISKLKHLDPEMPNVNQGYYPQQRIFEFGVNVTF